MERSKLENINDKIIVKIISNIINEFDELGNDWDECFDSQTDYDIFESNLRSLGIRPETIDVDYVFTLIKLNIKNEFKLPLLKPKLGLYELNVNISERVIQTQTYEHNVYSYDDGTASLKFRFEENEGLISVYDGNITDTDVHDSESFDWDYLDPIKIREF